MAKTNGTYELMYVINPVLSEEQTKAIVARVQELIQEADGDILRLDEWGSRRLAYPIQKKRNGYYVVVYFSGPATLLPRVDRALRINDDILRHMMLRYDAKMLRHFEKKQTETPETQPVTEPEPETAEA